MLNCVFVLMSCASAMLYPRLLGDTGTCICVTCVLNDSVASIL